jgi:hypothetical protein
MKFKSIIFIALAVFTQIANAQTFGIKAGANFAKMTDLGSDQKSILGFHVGPVVDFELRKNIYFNSGLLYSLKGSKIKGIGDYGKDIQTIKLNCVEMPLNIAYKFSNGEASSFFVQAGPYLDYVINGNVELDGKKGDIVFGGENQMRRFELGIGIGCGYEFHSILTSLSYQYGLTNQFDSQDAMVRNKVLQLSVAYMFGK